jgi:hypothetical protein
MMKSITAFAAFLTATTASTHQYLDRRQSSSGYVELDISLYTWPDNIGLQIGYAANVSIGTPPQNVLLMVDTGSSDTWVPQAGSPLCTQPLMLCNPNGTYPNANASQYAFDPHSSTSFQVNHTGVTTSFLDGTIVSGPYFQDILGFGQASIQNANLVLAQNGTETVSRGGMLGLGFPNSEAAPLYPNVVVQMRQQGLINSMVFSVWLNDKSKFSNRRRFVWTFPCTPHVDRQESYHTVKLGWDF